MKNSTKEVIQGKRTFSGGKPLRRKTSRKRRKESRKERKKQEKKEGKESIRGFNSTGMIGN